jgi:hypothetical protein
MSPFWFSCQKLEPYALGDILPYLGALLQYVVGCAEAVSVYAFKLNAKEAFTHNILGKFM